MLTLSSGNENQPQIEITNEESALVWLRNGSLMLIGNRDDLKTKMLWVLSQWLSHDTSFISKLIDQVPEGEKTLLLQPNKKKFPKG